MVSLLTWVDGNAESSLVFSIKYVEFGDEILWTVD